MSTLAKAAHKFVLPEELASWRARLEWVWLITPFLLLAYLVSVPGLLNSHQDAIEAMLALHAAVFGCFSVVVLALGLSWAMSGRADLPIAPTGLVNGVVVAGFSAILLAFTLLPLEGFQLFLMLGQVAVVFGLINLLVWAAVRAWMQRHSLPHALARPSVRDYVSLMKISLNGLVLATTLVGYFMGAQPHHLNVGHCALALVGTALVAWGASALNQFLERDTDASMRRTAVRPLPAGRMAPHQALVFGALLSSVGLVVLMTVNLATAWLGALTLAIYVFLYTPLKRINTLSTLAGGICGALPPIMGWTAAGGRFGAMPLILFTILFCWQIPHFLAIAWKYREQYGKAGFPLYTVLDPEGSATARQTLLYGVALLATTLLPLLQHDAGALYLWIALPSGLALCALALRFLLKPARPTATRLFFFTLIYLPLVLGALVVDRWLTIRDYPLF